jgi:hypothetical protein
MAITVVVLPKLTRNYGNFFKSAIDEIRWVLVAFVVSSVYTVAFETTIYFTQMKSNQRMTINSTAYWLFWSLQVLFGEWVPLLIVLCVNYKNLK